MNSILQRRFSFSCFLKGTKLLVVAWFGFIFSANAQWSSTEKIDPMTSNRITTWTLKSTDSLALGFPYSGSNFVHLFVRQGRQGSGFDVFVAAEKGQIICSQIESCSIAVRFDQQPATRFAAAHPSDGSPNVVFLEGAARFIQGAKKSTTIRVKLDFFHNGSHVVEFVSPTPLKIPDLSSGAVKPTAPKPSLNARKTTRSPAEDSAKDDATTTRWILEIGDYAEVGEARAARLKLEQAGIKTFALSVGRASGSAISVRAGPFNSRTDADAAAKVVRDSGMSAKIVGL